MTKHHFTSLPLMAQSLFIKSEIGEVSYGAVNDLIFLGKINFSGAKVLTGEIIEVQAGPLLQRHEAEPERQFREFSCVLFNDDKRSGKNICIRGPTKIKTTQIIHKQFIFIYKKN